MSEEAGTKTNVRQSVSTSKKFRFPCTGRTEMAGFAAFLQEELGESRGNLSRFASELEAEFGWPSLSLTNSGSSANLAAALTVAEMCRKQDGHTLEDMYKWKADQGSAPPLGEVIVAGFTFPSTVSGLLTAGFDVRAVDTEKGGFNMCPEALQNAITEKTRAICVTHWLGYPAQMDKIMQIARGGPRRLFVIQDACETMGMQLKGKSLDQYGDVSTWSFYHPHHMSSFGGGALSSPHSEWQRVVESYIHWGRECTCHFSPSSCQAPKGMHHHFYYVRQGHNLEMSELNACFGRYQLKQWTAMERQRKENFSTLYEALKDAQAVHVYEQAEGCDSPFVFPITLKDATTMGSVTKQLEELGIEYRCLMGGAITGQPVYQHLAADSLTNCKAMTDATLVPEKVVELAAILKDIFS